MACIILPTQLVKPIEYETDDVQTVNKKLSMAFMLQFASVLSRNRCRHQRCYPDQITLIKAVRCQKLVEIGCAVCLRQWSQHPGCLQAGSSPHTV
eukprot:6174029-Pleurochrysis_carterae.AAC.2